MKNSLSIISALTLAFPIGAFAQGTMKIGTVDMQRAFKEYNKTKEAEVKINDAKNAAKKEYDDRAESYKKALDEINNLNKQLESPALSADKKTQTAKERDDKIANIKNMEREISDFRQTRERQLQEQLMRVREGIVKEITDVVMEKVKTNNMDLVFDKSGMSINGVPFLLYSHDNIDFTNDIITVLNKPGRAASSTARWTRSRARRSPRTRARSQRTLRAGQRQRSDRQAARRRGASVSLANSAFRPCRGRRIEHDSMLHRLKPGNTDSVSEGQGPVSGHVPSGRKASDVVHVVPVRASFRGRYALCSGRDWPERPRCVATDGVRRRRLGDLVADGVFLDGLLLRPPLLVPSLGVRPLQSIHVKMARSPCHRGPEFFEATPAARSRRLNAHFGRFRPK